MSSLEKVVAMAENELHLIKDDLQITEDVDIIQELSQTLESKTEIITSASTLQEGASERYLNTISERTEVETLSDAMVFDVNVVPMPITAPNSVERIEVVNQVESELKKESPVTCSPAAHTCKTTVKQVKTKPVQRKKLPEFTFASPPPSSRCEKPPIVSRVKQSRSVHKRDFTNAPSTKVQKPRVPLCSPKVTSASSRASSSGSNFKTGNSNLNRSKADKSPYPRSSTFSSTSGTLGGVKQNAKPVNKMDKSSDINPACSCILEAAKNAMKNTDNLTISESCNHLQFKCCTDNARDAPTKIQVYLADTTSTKCPFESCPKPSTCPKYKKRRIRPRFDDSSPDSGSDMAKTQGIRDAFMSLVKDKSWMKRETCKSQAQQFDRRKQIISNCKIQTFPGISIPTKAARENTLLMDVKRNEDKFQSYAPDLNDKLNIPLASKSTNISKRPYRNKPLPIRPSNRLRGKQPLPFRAAQSKVQFEVGQRSVKQTNPTKRFDKSSASSKRIDSQCSGRTDKAGDKIFNSCRLPNQCFLAQNGNSLQISKCNKCVGGDMTDSSSAHFKYEPKTSVLLCDEIINASSSARKPKTCGRKHGDNKENEFNCEPTAVELNICDTRGLKPCLKKKLDDTHDGMPDKIRSIMQPSECVNAIEKDDNLEARIENLLKGAKLAITKNSTSCRAQQTKVNFTTTACSPIVKHRPLVDSFVQHVPENNRSLHTLITTDIPPVQVPPSRGCSICDSQDFIENLLTHNDPPLTIEAHNDMPLLQDQVEVYPLQEYKRDSIVQVHEYDLRTPHGQREPEKLCINAKKLQRVVDELIYSPDGGTQTASDKCPNPNCKDGKVRETYRTREGSSARRNSVRCANDENTYRHRDDCANASATKYCDSYRQKGKERHDDDSLREQLSEIMTPSIEAILRQRLADKRDEKIMSIRKASSKIEDARDSKEQMVVESKKQEKLRRTSSVGFIDKTFHECVCEKCQQICRKQPEPVPPPPPPETPVKKSGCCGRRKKKKAQEDCQEQCVARLEKFVEAQFQIEPTPSTTPPPPVIEKEVKLPYECGVDDQIVKTPCIKEVCKEEFGEKRCNKEPERVRTYPNPKPRNPIEKEDVNYIICRDNDGTCDRSCKLSRDAKYERPNDCCRNVDNLIHESPNNTRIKLQPCMKRDVHNQGAGSSMIDHSPKQVRAASVQRNSVKSNKPICNDPCPIGVSVKARPTYSHNKPHNPTRNNYSTIRHCQIEPININSISPTTSNAVFASSENYSLTTERSSSNHKVTVRPFKDDDFMSSLSLRKSFSDKSDKSAHKKKYSFSTSPIKSNIAKKFEIVQSAITSIGHSKTKARRFSKEKRDSKEFDWKTFKYKSKDAVSPSSSMSPLFGTSSDGELDCRCSCSVSAGEVHDCSIDSISDYYSKDSVLQQNDSLHIAGHHRNIYSGNLVSYYVISSAQNPHPTTSNKL